MPYSKMAGMIGGFVLLLIASFFFVKGCTELGSNGWRTTGFAIMIASIIVMVIPFLERLIYLCIFTLGFLLNYRYQDDDE